MHDIGHALAAGKWADRRSDRALPLGGVPTCRRRNGRSGAVEYRRGPAGERGASCRSSPACGGSARRLLAETLPNLHLWLYYMSMAISSC